MTTNSTQGSGEDAASDNPYSLRLRARAFERFTHGRKGGHDTFPLPAIFLSILAVAPIMVVGLPLAAFWIVQHSGCCSDGPLASEGNFWGSAIAGMLALFGMLITAVFIITAFRVDKNAKFEAIVAATDGVGEFLDKYKVELLEGIDGWAGEAEAEKDRAIKRIDAATIAAESASNTALANIEEVRQNVVQRGEQAVETINAETSDVANARTTAVERIEAEVAEVERVAAEARARIEAEGPDQSTPTDSQE